MFDGNGKVEFQLICPNIYLMHLRNSRIVVASICFVTLLFIMYGNVCLAAEPIQTQSKKVLVIPSSNVNYPATKLFLQGIFEEFKAQPSLNIIYSYEDLQLMTNSLNDKRFITMADSLKIKYSTQQPDLIIVLYKPALEFMNKYGKYIFGDVPVVFAGVENENFNTIKLPINYAGVIAASNTKMDIDLIIKNNPGTKKIYIVTGASVAECELVDSILKYQEMYKDKIEFIALNNLPFEMMLEKLSTIGTDSAIMYLSIRIDVNGKIKVPAEAVKEIADIAHGPIYSVLDTFMGSGITGGFLVNHVMLGHRVAEIGTAILLDKKVNIGIATEMVGTYRFDWRQLKRWRIDEKMLPIGSEIEFKDIDLWERYKWHIIGGLCLLILQGILITILAINRIIRKKAQVALKQSEEQLKISHQELTASYEELTANEEELRNSYQEVMKANIKLEDSYQTIAAIFNAASDAIIVNDPEKGDILAVNSKASKLFGYSEQEFKQLGIVAITTPMNMEDTLRRIRKSIDDEQFYECETEDRFGQRLVLEISASRVLIYGKNSCLAIIREITQRKQMEEKLRFISLHDSLTGVFNRVHFEEEMQLLRNKGYKSIGILVCDVDGLKIINDTLGHYGGDELLKRVATILNIDIMKPNFTARIGGDEFAVVVFDSTKKQMEKLEKRYKEAVADYNKEAPQLPLSISTGWAIDMEGFNIDMVFKEADNNMYRQKMHQQQSSHSALVQTMMKALEARDHITEGHADRLGELMEMMGQRLKLSQGAIADLRLFAKFHDIGKVGIPDSILNKPGQLTEEEMVIMRQHCEIGFRIAKASADLEPIADWILKHQEHWNGNGYPLGISGNDIPVECRVLAIVDAYDAMVNDRPYRKAMSPEDAIVEIKNCIGTQFDPQLVETFIEMLEK